MRSSRAVGSSIPSVQISGEDEETLMGPPEAQPEAKPEVKPEMKPDPLPPIGLATAAVIQALDEWRKAKPTRNTAELAEDITQALRDFSRNSTDPLPPVLLSLLSISQALIKMVEHSKADPLPPLLLAALEVVETLREGIKKGQVTKELLKQGAVGSFILARPAAAARRIATAEKTRAKSQAPPPQAISRKRKASPGCMLDALLTQTTHLAVFFLCKHCKENIRVSADEVETDTPTGCNISFPMCFFCREQNVRLRRGF